MYISRFLQTFFDQFLLLTMNYFDKVGGAGGSWKDVMLREISMDGTIWVGQAREHARATWVGWKGESNMMSRGGEGHNPMLLKFHAFCSTFWREFVIYPVIFYTFYVVYSRA